MATEQEMQIYNDEWFILRRQLRDLESEKEFIQLQLKYFYHILNKNVRLLFIKDIRKYIDRLESQFQDIQVDQEAKAAFLDIERSIRTNPYNDQTVNFMISGLIDALDRNQESVNKIIINFIQQLVFNLHKYTAMCYQSGMGGGIILYANSLQEDLYLHEVKADAIFYFGPEETIM